MPSKIGYFLVLILIFPITSAIMDPYGEDPLPMVINQSVFQELEELLAGNVTDVRNSSDLRQIYGNNASPEGQIIGEGLNNFTYVLPFADLLKNSSIFGDFLESVSSDLTPPHKNRSQDLLSTFFYENSTGDLESLF
jgi:hypothetical protein